jgi:hypothetical protein
MFEPKVIKNIFDEPFFQYIQNYFANHPQIKNIPYDNYGSKRLDSFDDIVILECLDKLTNFAREKFAQKDIVPTYGVFAEYSGANAQLDEHLDVGPCTYTLDIGLYHNTPWNLFIENKEYEFDENEGILFLANDQRHWKESFPDPEINKVGILLLHWVSPDHPWLKYSPEVQKLIKKRTSVK